MQLLDDILITGSAVPALPPARPLASVPDDVLFDELHRRFPAYIFSGCDLNCRITVRSYGGTLALVGLASVAEFRVNALILNVEDND